MISYLLPVLMLSLVILLLNHQAVISSSSYVEEAAPSLKRISGSINTSQKRAQEKTRLDFIVAGFPKCVSFYSSSFYFSANSIAKNIALCHLLSPGNHYPTLRLPAPQRDPDRST